MLAKAIGRHRSDRPQCGGVMDVDANTKALAEGDELGMTTWGGSISVSEEIA